MAKKKTNNQEKPAEQHQNDTTTMDDSSEKLQSLKSLNSRLLRETVERRREVDSLKQSKEDLESELSRFKMEKKLLDSELTELRERTVGLELEKTVMSRLFEAHIDGMRRENSDIEKVKSEFEVEVGLLKGKVSELAGDLEKEKLLLDGVRGEKDVTESERDFWVGEANELRLKMGEMCSREREIAQKASVLKMECEGLAEEKEKNERVIESLKVEKDLVEKSLAESTRLNEDLKTKIEGIVRDKEEIKKESNAQIMLIKELEKEVVELNESVGAMQREEKDLRMKVSELEKKLVDGMEKQEKMEMERNALVEERDEIKRRFKSSIEENLSTMNSLEETLKQLDDKNKRLEEISGEKNAIEEVKVKHQREIVELQKEKHELMDLLSTLEKKLGEIAMKNKQLQSEVTHYREAFDRVAIERDGVKKALDEEKKHGNNLKIEVLELKNGVKETLKELDEMKLKHEDLIRRKKEVESVCERLLEEKDSALKSLVLAEQTIDDMQDRMESLLADSEKAFAMLKNTALVCLCKDEKKGKHEEGADEQNTKEEIQPFVTELEAIKDAFRCRETKVEAMKQQVEILEKSVAEARKNRNFWTLVSSATTIFAAASVAYAAKGH